MRKVNWVCSNLGPIWKHSKTNARKNLLGFLAPSDDNENVKTEKVCDPMKVLGWSYDKGLVCPNDGEPGLKHNFWDNVDVQSIRMENEAARLNYLLAQYRSTTYQTQELNTRNVVARENNKRGRLAERETRKKRSTDTTSQQNLTAKTMSQQNLTTYSFNIFDEDSNSNFKLKECKIWEESKEGEVIETHLYDFESNTLFEDSKTDSGSNLTAFYANEDGVEVLADKESRPEVIQDVTISISNSPLNGTADTTSPQNMSSYFFSISDEDSSSDLELKDCRIWEKSEGTVIETHVYDFESNTLIEDRNVDSGSTLTAAFTDEEGAEVEAEKEVTEVETISIVLRPR